MDGTRFDIYKEYEIIDLGILFIGILFYTFKLGKGHMV